MDFKVKSSIIMDVLATHVFNFYLPLIPMITNIIEKSKTSRYCWDIGVYVDLSQGPWKVIEWPLDELEIR